MKRLTFVLLLIVLAGVGCKFFDSLKGGGGSGGSGASSGGDPKSELIAASRKFMDLKSFSAKMEGVGQTEIKSQVDFIAPDRFHVSYLGGTGAGMELIYIGGDSYMKTGGKWSKMPGDAKSIPNLRDSFTEEGLKSLTDVKFEGDDTVDGKAALVYSYKNVTPIGNYSFTSKMWVGKSTGVPIKIYAEYTNGVLKQMTVNYDTESPVTIEPPIK